MHTFRFVALAALAMSVGWGFRGDYGHESGAILPGALLGLAIAMASGRPDWQQRSTLIALFCGLGWAIGGQMSYGIVIGYTAGDTLANVAYGFACLFAIGALWGGIGGAALGVSLTWSRQQLGQFAWPLIFIGVAWFALDISGRTEQWTEQYLTPVYHRWAPFDVDWIAAASALAISLVAAAVPQCRRAALVIALMSLGWLLGFVLLVDVAGLRMTPPRSDNWAGCVGMLLALVIWLIATRQFAVLLLVSAGMLAGGFGFAIGDFWHMLGRAKWGPIGGWQPLAVQNYWKWMEQFFGLLMGFGVALGITALIRAPLEPAQDDRPRGAIDLVAILFLLVVMPWLTLGQNIDTWSKAGWLPASFAGIKTQWWLLGSAALVSCAPILAAFKLQSGNLAMAPASHLGRAQWLFVLLLWICLAGDFARALPVMGDEGVFSVHLSFWITAGIATLLTLSINEPPRELSPGLSARDALLRPSRRQIALWLVVPLVIVGLAVLTLASHDGPLPGSRARFETQEE
jgi:hypothetical protein